MFKYLMISAVCMMFVVSCDVFVDGAGQEGEKCAGEYKNLCVEGLTCVEGVCVDSSNDGDMEFQKADGDTENTLPDGDSSEQSCLPGMVWSPTDNKCVYSSTDGDVADKDLTDNDTTTVPDGDTVTNPDGDIDIDKDEDKDVPASCDGACDEKVLKSFCMGENACRCQNGSWQGFNCVSSCSNLSKVSKGCGYVSSFGYDFCICEDATSPDGDVTDTDSASQTWVDTNTGFEWQLNVSSNTYDQSSAISHCADLGSGWRLPNISELRTIVSGCTQISIYGACNVQDNCSSCGEGPITACLDKDKCHTTTSCQPTTCADNSGPDAGCYWDKRFEGLCSAYWSSSIDSISEQGWRMGFYSAGITAASPLNTHYVRCVRSTER